MIISQQKPMDEIDEMLKRKGSKKIVLTGCSECATVCKVGGEEELKAMKETLESMGYEVLGQKVLTTSCNLLLDKKELKELKEELKETDAVLCMACGDGVQTVASNVKDKPVYPANDTMFIGEIKRNGLFEEACRSCGECVLGITGGICPVTKCAKSLLNGPCGGAKNGKCEVDPENDCAWILIYNRLKDLGQLENLDAIIEPKNYQKVAYPRTIDTRGGAK
ncbi:MAG: methylenetetrahydrofolate reductase C-terminal domain-containing protein [Eubacteriales bacterium]